MNRIRSPFALRLSGVILLSQIPAHAIDFVWTNPGVGSWFEPTNWDQSAVPAGGGGNHVRINNGGTATIDADTINQIQDPFIGRGAGNVGHVSQTAGTFSNVGWTFIGTDNGTGSYTMTGSSNLNTGRIYIGGVRDLGGGNGTMTITTTGTVTAGSDLAVATRGGTGLLTVNAGTINANSWMIVGESHNGVGGSNGTVIQNGGTLTVGATDGNGRLWIGSQEGSASPASNGTYTLNNGTLTTPEAQIGRHYTGTFNQAGGTFTITNRESGLGDVAGSVGTYNMSGGVLNSPANFQIGRSGTGIFTQTGGVVNVSNFPSIGRFGGSSGTLSISAGSYNQLGAGGRLIVGEDGTAVLNLSGTGAVSSEGGISLGHNGIGNGTFNLDGGMVTAPFFESANGGTAKFNFNGGVLRASQTEGDFFRSVNLAASEIEVKSGGAKIDSNGFDVTINQALAGAGGLAKQGSGALILTGANTFFGDTVVEGGTLRLGSAAGLFSPRIIVRSGAGFDVTMITGFTLGAGQTLEGSGSVFGDVALAPGAGLAPGDGAGVLSLSNGLNIGGGIAEVSSGALEFELGALGSSDLVFLSSGVLSIGAGLLEFDDFNFTALSGFGPGDYTLFDTSVLLDGALGSNLTGTINGFGATLTTANNGQDLVVKVVPEPGTAVLLAGGLAFLVRRRRR